MLSLASEIGDLLPSRTMSTDERSRLNRLVKRDLVEAMRPHVREVAPYLTVKGRTGREVAWAHVPWVGVHDPRIDAGARTGVFVALLFRVDGSGAVLSLQVGSASRTRAELEAAVADVRDAVDVPDGFTTDAPVLIPDDLRPDYDRALSPYRYERASVCARTTELSDGDAGFANAFLDLLNAYHGWTTREGGVGSKMK